MTKNNALLILCRHFSFVHFSPEKYQIHLQNQSFIRITTAGEYPLGRILKKI